jgi:branched-subunit amino acid aminotransferase/4-amino-4-deoxychorismate lyase
VDFAFRENKEYNKTWNLPTKVLFLTQHVKRLQVQIKSLQAELQTNDEQVEQTTQYN